MAKTRRRRRKPWWRDVSGKAVSRGGVGCSDGDGDGDIGRRGRSACRGLAGADQWARQLRRVGTGDDSDVHGGLEVPGRRQSGAFRRAVLLVMRQAGAGKMGQKTLIRSHSAAGMRWAGLDAGWLQSRWWGPELPQTPIYSSAIISIPCQLWKADSACWGLQVKAGFLLYSVVPYMMIVIDMGRHLTARAGHAKTHMCIHYQYQINH